ncbi:MAG: glycosyltransferase family 4 protein [Desulfobacterales bacterium]|nr:glycosyltransferase family 4 protein [Desulfobacterales bacterium]
MLPHDARLYEDTDICIQPSVFEGCSITILEAMGTGIPVIASNIDGPKELIIPGKTGILVPPKHPDALKDAVLDLIENKEKAVKIGNAGNLRASEKFSSKVFIDKMSQIYQTL